VAEAAQFALDATVAPAGIVTGKSEDQLGEFGAEPGSAGTGRLGPLAFHLLGGAKPAESPD